jgi:malate dehydrogenase (quinone)
MIEFIVRCFKEELASAEWQEKLKKMIPSYGQALNENPALSDEIRKNTAAVLKLKN